MEREKEKFIARAKYKLENNKNISDEFRTVLTKWSEGVCDTCNSEITVISVDQKNADSQVTTHLRFKCGHGVCFVEVDEKIKIWEMNRLMDAKSQKKAKLIVKVGNSVSGDSEKHPKGVKKYMKIDRKNNLYVQKITDIETGIVTHKENQLLSDHQ